MECKTYNEKDRSISFLISLFIPLSFIIMLIWGWKQYWSKDSEVQLKGRGKIRGALEATSLFLTVIVMLYALLKMCFGSQLTFVP